MISSFAVLTKIYKQKFNAIQIIVLFITSSILLSGCAAAGLAEVVAIEDLGAIALSEGAILRSATLTMTRAGVVAEDIAAVNAAIRRVRLASTGIYASNPQLVYTMNGQTTRFASILNTNTIRLTNSGKIIHFPYGEIYTVKKNLVNLRSSREINPYNFFASVEQDEVVLVLEKYSDGWARVEIGRGLTGFMELSLLAAVPLSTIDDSEISLRTCPSCEGTGHTLVHCSKCSGFGRVSCSNCLTGTIRCESCSGFEKNRCTPCMGFGNIHCSACGGLGNINSFSGPIPCKICNARGQVACLACKGTGAFACQKCKGKGYLTCGTCNGQPQFSCKNCSGKGKIELAEKCFRCNGEGKIY
jgi:hypothetical protein